MRRRYLVSYDVRDAKRLREVHKAMKAFGYPLQYSVFVCDLDAIEKIALRQNIGTLVNQREDSIMMIDLGDPDRSGVECFEFLGPNPGLPRRGPKVV